MADYAVSPSVRSLSTPRASIENAGPRSRNRVDLLPFALWPPRPHAHAGSRAHAGAARASALTTAPQARTARPHRRDGHERDRKSGKAATVDGLPGAAAHRPQGMQSWRLPRISLRVLCAFVPLW
ncbi:MAG: hypothetical protein NTX42_03180 [Methanothrix sp.]|nr:hypothetical protein [Methanothrix sp.]